MFKALFRHKLLIYNTNILSIYRQFHKLFILIQLIKLDVSWPILVWRAHYRKTIQRLTQMAAAKKHA